MSDSPRATSGRPRVNYYSPAHQLAVPRMCRGLHFVLFIYTAEVKHYKLYYYGVLLVIIVCKSTSHMWSWCNCIHTQQNYATASIYGPWKEVQRRIATRCAQVIAMRFLWKVIAALAHLCCITSGEYQTCRGIYCQILYSQMNNYLVAKASMRNGILEDSIIII